MLKTGIIKRDLDNNTAYVVLAGTGGDELNKVLLGKAALSDMSISEQVNAQASAALNGDVLISTFGKGPVAVSMSGVEFYGTCGKSSASTDTVLEFYGKNNVHDNPTARVDLTVGKTSYTGALLSMVQDVGGNRDRAGSQTSNWTLQLVCVRK